MKEKKNHCTPTIYQLENEHKIISSKSTVGEVYISATYHEIICNNLGWLLIASK